MFNYRNSGIPRIYTYADALRILEKRKPIGGTGRNAGKRPLGERRKADAYTIRMRQDESIAARLYATDVVVYHKDGTITLDHADYESMTMAAFITDVLTTCCIYNNHLTISTTNGNYVVDNKLALQQQENGTPKVVSATTQYEYKINRKEANAVRKKYAEFRKYMLGMCKLKEFKFEADEFGEMSKMLTSFGFNRSVSGLGLTIYNSREKDKLPVLQKFMQWVESRDEDEGNWHKAATWLAMSTAWPYERNEIGINKKFDEVLFAMNPQVFERSELPTGSVRRNRYHKFVPFIEKVDK